MARDPLALENVLNIYEVKLGRGLTDTNPLRFTGVEGYAVKDVGKSINRVQQVNDETVYFHEQDYRDKGFITISFSAYCFKDDFDDLYANYKKAILNDTSDGRIFQFTDIYGHAYDYAYITNLDWELAGNNATLAVHVNMELIVLPHPDDNVFRKLKSGESLSSRAVTYIIEGCSIKPFISTPHQIIGADNSIKIYSPTAYSAKIYEITMNGIEMIDTSIGESAPTDFTRGAFTKTLVGAMFDFELVGFTSTGMKGALSNIETTMIQGLANFQNFNITMLVTADANFIDDSDNPTIIESWSCNELTPRVSWYKTLDSYLFQKFDSVRMYDVTMQVISDDLYTYESGQVVVAPFSLPGFVTNDGTQVQFNPYLILDRSFSKVEGTVQLKKFQVHFIAIPA